MHFWNTAVGGYSALESGIGELCRDKGAPELGKNVVGMLLEAMRKFPRCM